MAEKLTMNKSSAELGWKLTKYVEDEGGGGRGEPCKRRGEGGAGWKMKTIGYK